MSDINGEIQKKKVAMKFVVLIDHSKPFVSVHFLQSLVRCFRRLTVE
jgi:hypothetical protein